MCVFLFCPKTTLVSVVSVVLWQAMKHMTKYETNDLIPIVPTNEFEDDKW